jgi:hypothetical protein
MVVHYKSNGKDARIDNVDWVDIFMLNNGTNTAVIRRDDKITEIPLQDLVSITNK